HATLVRRRQSGHGETVAAQNIRIVTTATARDVRGESNGDDSKGVHSGKLALISSPEIPVVVVPMVIVPVGIISVIVVPMIPRVILILQLVLPSRLDPRGFHLAGANGCRLSLTRHLKLALARDLILALTCDLIFALAGNLELSLARDLHL